MASQKEELTSIKIKKSTLALLKTLKNKHLKHSIDEVIVYLHEISK